MKTKKIAISGGFDPIHPGHIAMIEDAAKYGEVHIIVNSDEWLVQKKDFSFSHLLIVKKYSKHTRPMYML